MIAESLKKALLQAAVQGKLTEQLPEDGDARDHLKDIQKEKTRLIKEGKIKKEKPLPVITDDEIPFDIPENWAWVRLGELIFLKSGQDLTPDKYHASKRGIPYITGASNFNRGSITIDRWTESPKSIASEGDLLITCKGTVGEMAFLQESQAHIARQVMAIRNIGELNLQYMYYLLRWFVDELISMAKSMIPGISREMVLRIVTPLPPRLEQERIVQKLESLLLEIESLKAEENILDNLEKAFPSKIRASILQAAIQGKLTEQLTEDGDARDLLKEIQKEKARLIKEGKIKKDKPLPAITEDEIPFDIPGSWVWVRLGNVIEQNLGGGTPSKANPNYWGGNIYWASVKDLNEKYLESTVDRITEKGLLNSSSNLIPKGNIIICTRMGLGKITMNSIDVAINQDLRAIFLPDKVNKWYFFHFYSTLIFAGKGATVKGVSVDEINNTLMPLPPFAEQKRIVEKLEVLLPLCDALE